MLDFAKNVFAKVAQLFQHLKWYYFYVSDVGYTSKYCRRRAMVMMIIRAVFDKG